MFDWWGKNNIYGVDFKAGINTETVKYYIDFCAKFGFRYFLFDDGWCVKQRRKYPNVLTREALIEFEYNGMSDHENPVHHNLLPYIRMFADPMDYIPATMRNST
ncbi:MAG TPA: hypothetical protein DCP74_06475, partial [Bacteroidales bacterium]|nr:hypothetical protein [Bacteroidales bacterium]